jgi:DNA-binding MarR family transcriptional regulator
MDDVNQRPAQPHHLAFLLNRVIRRLRDDATPPASWPDLTAAKARLIEMVPPGGCRIVDLSGEMRVSKQGLGQLVKQLIDGGYLNESQDPGDRRARIITRTREGDRVVEQVHQISAELEARWRAEVGAKKYDVFHEVLVRLVDGAQTGKRQ